MAEVKQVKPAWKQKKTWAALLSGVGAVAVAVTGAKFGLSADIQKVLIGVIAFIGTTFIGAEQWKDGKVISAKILADAQTAIEVAKKLNSEQPKN